MKFCDFFSGIGGFRLGLERAGHKGVWACEIEDFPRKIYAQHFEEPQGKDINDVKPNEIPEADLWCGGFPCQDLSVAGKRGGLQANRSGLYWVWYELMRKRKPQWLLIENVPGLLSSRGGADFALILSSLDELGYGVAWRVLDAQFFGLAQRRKRVFIIGRFGKPCPPEILFEREGLRGDTQAQRKAGSEIARAITTSVTRWKPDQETYIISTGHTKANQKGIKRGGVSETLSGAQDFAIAPTLYASGAGTERTASAGNEAQFCVVGTLTNAGRGKRGWQVSAEDARDGHLVCAPPPNPNGMREAAGIRGRIHTPDSPRYKALGNAVAVPVIEWIGRRLPK